MHSKDYTVMIISMSKTFYLCKMTLKMWSKEIQIRWSIILGPIIIRLKNHKLKDLRIQSSEIRS